MPETLRAHVITHLRFFARSRLILGFALVVLGIWALTLIPFLLFESSGQRLNLLIRFSGQLHGLAWLSGAGLALVGVASHVRNGATRLVFTRPAAPEVWLASIFLAAMIVAGSVHVLAEAVTIGLAVTWGVPYQVGFLYLSLDHVLETVIAISMMGALAALLHPVIAVLVAFVANSGMIEVIRMMVQSAQKAEPTSTWPAMIDWPLYAVYVLLPDLDPFAEQTSSVSQSLRVTADQWAYLAATAGYAVGAFAFFFLLSAYSIRRRPTIS